MTERIHNAHRFAPRALVRIFRVCTRGRFTLAAEPRDGRTCAGLTSWSLAGILALALGGAAAGCDIASDPSDPVLQDAATSPDGGSLLADGGGGTGGANDGPGVGGEGAGDPGPAEGEPPGSGAPPEDSEPPIGGDDEPPAYDPPGDEPPAYDPPGDEPPADEPPAYDPPVDEPPVDEPPVDEPQWPSCGDAVCDGGETCTDCPTDCACDGYCAPDGVCAELLPPYAPCSLDEQCQHGLCAECDAASGKRFCVAPESRGLGDVCRLDVECAVGACNNDGAYEPFGGVCASNQGICQCVTDADCGPSEYCNGIVNTDETACFTKQPSGGPCLENRWCLSNACNLGTNTCN